MEGKKQRIFTLDSGRVEVNGISLGLPLATFQESLIEQGFVLVDKGSPIVLKGNINGLGTCFLKIFREKDPVADLIGLVIIITEHKYNENEMMEIFEQLKEDLHDDPLYDDGGYGVLPKPHEIRHFWDIAQGYVTINWHGDDDRDNITFWLRKPLVKDEAYWRSEVD